jgi:hypothetical protein
MSRFYRVVDDMSASPRWFLQGPTTPSGDAVDPRLFTYGRPLPDPGPLYVELRRGGPALDFTLADFDMPIVSRELGVAIEAVAPGAVQRFPVTISGTAEPYEILNVVDVVHCLDERRSTVQYWQPSDGRPEKVGEYRMVVKETIDPLRAAGKHIFRLGGWTITLVADDTLRAILWPREFTGLEFQPLSD